MALLSASPHSRRAALLLPVLLATLAGGCFSAPRHAAEVGFGGPASLAAHAPTYWKGSDLPSSGFAARPRVAVLEFSVEYVTTKKLGLFGSRPIADVQEFSITGGAAHLAGLGREKLELDEGTMRQLPSALEKQFERTLELAGFDVIGPDRVAASPAFAALVTLTPGEPYAGQFLSPVGSDTGRPKEIRVFPAEGLKILPREAENQTLDLRRVLAETGGELGLIVRVRVGADEGFASIERDSHIRVVTASGEVQGRLTALHSILSDGRIAADESFRLFSGSVTTADAALYREEVQRLAEPFLGMAVAELRGPEDRWAAGAVSGLSPAQLAKLMFEPDARTPLAADPQ